MSCACQGRLGAMVAVVAGVAAVTVGAVNFARTGCPLGSCGCADEAVMVATPAASEPKVAETAEAQMTDQEKAAAEIKKEEARLKTEAEKKAAEAAVE